MTNINWKQHGDFSFYGYYKGVMIWKAAGASGSLFWLDSTPAIQYSTEAELIKFLNIKHRAA